MCFNNATAPAASATPAETLDQAAPRKKTAAPDLSIGTKRYRNDAAETPSNAKVPSGIPLN